MEFTDKRGRRMIYLSRCLLNQNSRTPGIAVQKGAIAALIQVLLDNELGIEQLPCPECLFWGGVSRKDTYRMQPLVFASIGKKWFPIIRFLFKIWLYRSDWLCKREAIKTVNRMDDFINEGYSIAGIVGVNDSPTCGVTNTVNLLKIVENHKSLGIRLADIENPDIEKFKLILQKVREEGTGAFIGSIMAEVKKRHLNIKSIGFDPWLASTDEIKKITDYLDLER